jgi:hypothetical protein
MFRYLMLVLGQVCKTCLTSVRFWFWTQKKVKWKIEKRIDWNDKPSAQQRWRAITFNAMKNYSRAYNKHKQETKFKRRVKNWFASHWKNDKEEIGRALKGEAYRFLKTTGRPCNCYGCTYRKYKRDPKHKVVKEAMKDLHL